MKLDGRTYDILKWCTLVLIPACTTLYVALSAIWGFPYASEVAKTSAAVCCFLGAVLGISSAQYYKDDSEWLDDPAEEDGEDAQE
jgi:hypothetical protein